MASIGPAVMTRPSDSTAMREQIACRLSRSCVTMNTLNPNVCCKRMDQFVELGGADRIEAGCGLVEKDDFRIQRKRAGERDALDHAARKLGRIFLAHIGLEPDHFQFRERNFIHEARRQLRYSRIGNWTFCKAVSEENKAPC